MKNKRLIVLLSIVLIALFSVGVGVYLHLNSNKVIFSKALTKTFDNMFEENGLLSNLDYDIMKIETKTNVKLSAGAEKYALNLDGNIGYNDENKKLYVDMNTNLNNKKLVDFQALLEGNKVYFKLKDLMTKFYFIDLGIDALDEFDSDDVEHIMGLLKTSFFDNLNDKDFTKSKQKLSLSEQDFSTTKLSLKLTEEKVYDIMIDFLNSLKNDKKSMSMIQKLEPEFTEKSIDEALKEFEESKKEINNNNYLLYTILVDKNQNILRHEFSINDVDDDSFKDMMVAINCYKTNNNYENIELILLNKGTEVVNLSVNQTAKDESKLTLTSALIKAEGTIKTTDVENSYNITVSDILGTKLGDIVCVIKKHDNKSYTYELTVNGVIEGINLAIDSDNIIILDTDIVEFDVTGSQSIDTMPETEQNTILNAIMERLGAVMQ